MFNATEIHIILSGDVWIYLKGYTLNGESKKEWQKIKAVLGIETIDIISKKKYL